MVINTSTEAINDILLDTPLAGGVGSDVSRDHFGGPESVWCHIRVRGLDYALDALFSDTDAEKYTDAFGIYLGRHGDKWIVGVKPMLSLTNKIRGIVEYASLESLKAEWELD